MHAQLHDAKMSQWLVTSQNTIYICCVWIISVTEKNEFGSNTLPLLLGLWYEIMALYYVKSILTEISASSQDKRVLQKSKVLRIKFFEHMGRATDV